jgi:hypothetical protein
MVPHHTDPVRTSYMYFIHIIKSSSDKLDEYQYRHLYANFTSFNRYGTIHISTQNERNVLTKIFPESENFVLFVLFN